MAVVAIPSDGRVTRMEALDANTAQLLAGSLVVALFVVLLLGVAWMLAAHVRATGGRR